MNKKEKLGYAKKDLKAGDNITIILGKDGLLHSEEINCFESITLRDFLELKA